jgi:hypothetical protein
VLTIFGLTIAMNHIGHSKLEFAVIMDGLLAIIQIIVIVLWFQSTSIIPTDGIQLSQLRAAKSG